jgi:isocitrate/isopropylmalate dehydrogenase
LNGKENMTQKYRIAVLAGDGIGKEVMVEGLKALRAVEKKDRGI